MFSPQEITLIVIVVIGLALILSNRLRADVGALIIMLALSVFGVITPEEALSGLSRPAITTLIGLFIITNALEETGIVQRLANRIRLMGGGSEARLIVIFMGAGALLSLVMNNIAAGAVLLPAAVQVGRDSNVNPSKLLMPLAFGTLVGGMATYFTTANIVVSSILVDQGQDGLTMLDFLPTGGLIVLVSLVFMATIGRRLLPDRQSAAPATASSLSRALSETYQLEERLWELHVQPESRLIGVPLKDSHIGEELGISVLAVWRGHEAILNPEPTETIQNDDYLLVVGQEERVRRLFEWGLKLGRAEKSDADPRRYRRKHEYAVDLTEVIIPPRSTVVGKSLLELRFRNRYGLTTVALWREGRSYRTDVGKFRLQVGDALLMVGPAKRINALAQDKDFMVMQSSHAFAPSAPNKMLWALAITAFVLIASIFEFIPTPEAMLLGGVAMVLTGCINMDEAYRAIEWRVIFLIAGMSAVSIGMINTGLAERVGVGLVNTLDPYGAIALIAGLFGITMLATQIMGGQVSGLVMGPIAVSAGLQIGMHVDAIAVAVAIACSTAFLTPMAHPVNVLMMGPGGYTQSDFIKVGFFMTVLVFIATLAGMVLFWGVT